MIPKQLKNLSFCRIKKGRKAPFEMDWNNKPYTYDEISSLFPKENYGVLCGYHNLAVVDCDSDQLKLVVEQLLPQTFSVKTGGGGTHFYYFIPKLKQKIILEADNKHLGEIQFKGQQVVGVGSLHPNGKTYEIIDNVGIKEISLKELEDILGKFMKKQEVKFEGKENIKNYENLVSEIVKVWKEGDRQELALSVSGYLRKEKRLGINKVKQIIKEVCEITEDEELKMRLRAVDETFKKDEKNIKGFTGLGKVNLEASEIEFYNDEELIDREFPEPEWIIKNQIPKGEVGILAGKRGERKTFFALYQAICSSAGIDCIEDEINKKSKVVFVSEEDGIVALAPRIKGLKKGLGIEKEKLDIKYFTLNNLKLDQENGKTKEFYKIINEFNPDLIIIDTLQRCVSFDADTDNKSISEFFTGRIRPLQKKYGGTWLFIHHLRKGISGQNQSDDLMDEIRGGSEIVNYPRFVLICQTPKNQSGLLVITPVKMSYAELSEPKVIGFVNDDSDKSIKIEYIGLPKDVLKTEISCGKAIMEYLFRQNITEFRTKDIKEKEEEIGYKKSMIASGLKYLVERGDLEKLKIGYYSVKGIENDQQKL